VTASYHLAVLGDHLGGLAAAALAARRGKRVLLLETAAAESVRPLDLLNAVTGGPELDAGLGRLFQELGLAPFGPQGDDRIHFHALATPLQLCLPHHRVGIHADRTARTWELQREFGDAQRALPAIWQREQELREKLERMAPQQAEAGGALLGRAMASVSGFVRLQALERETSRQRFTDFLGELGLSPELRATLVAQAQAVVRRPGAGLTWAEGVRALRVANGGLYANAAGQMGVLVGLRAALISTGGDLRPLVALEGIDLPRTGGARLHLAAGGTVKADRVIVDLPLAEGRRHLPAEALKALERKGLEQCADAAYGLLEFSLAPGRRPVGMGNYLAIAAGSEDPDAASVLLAASEEGDDGRCQMEAIGFFAPQAAGGAREHLLARVRTIIPFLDESLAAEPVCRTGAAPHFTQERLDRGQREERLATGWRTSIFHQPPFTFLRNEDYALVGLAEGLLSGFIALA
jgi:phytoene dehydrogenase-like protein